MVLIIGMADEIFLLTSTVTLKNINCKPAILPGFPPLLMTHPALLTTMHDHSGRQRQA